MMTARATRDPWMPLDGRLDFTIYDLIWGYRIRDPDTRRLHRTQYVSSGNDANADVWPANANEGSMDQPRTASCGIRAGRVGTDR